MLQFSRKDFFQIKNNIKSNDIKELIKSNFIKEKIVSNFELKEIGRLYPPNYLHEGWNDFLYWDSELESE